MANECKDCGGDISDRHGLAKRCLLCAIKAKSDYNRKHAKAWYRKHRAKR